MIALPGVAIHSKIYESAASVVYRGIREQDECAIARSALPEAIVVKMLKQEYPSPQELTRYRQEYEITRSLNLEGVVKAFSQQDYQRTIAILLEDFGGESIERWMRQRPEEFCPMPLANFFRLAIDITDILGRIHHAKIVHKDINPGNIVFNPDTGVVKIIDFGIATRFKRTNPNFKSPHVLEGTLAYISPEQTGRMNRWLDYRTDFYSLGVTFYELLTGQLPFPTTDILELVHCHIAKSPVPPHELNAAIPKPVSDIIMKLMAKNAQDRYGSAWGIKADLETCDRQFAQSGQIDCIQLGLQDISEQFCIPQKLYGREEKIKALLAAFDRVAVRGNEENTQQFNVEMMLVSGYAGVGKSALVQELYKPITAKHGYFIWGKFDQFGRNIPYSAIAHALQKLVQQLLGEPDEQLQQWRTRLLAALGSNAQIVIDAIPELELIVGKQPPVPSVEATQAQNRFNLTFQKFVRVFCSKEHPLVIFLDDLQWIDSATLKLIELLLLDKQTQYLFLIGAYRDNEVTPTHPLVLMLEKFRKQGAVLQEITLAPLTPEPLSQLIAETLHCNIDTVRSLAQLVLRKTEGNPFFISEFLRMLYSENLLTFDAKQLSWQWDIAQIQAQNITDNVVELLLLQLKKLPEETRQILRLAACIGAEFDLGTLAIACKKSPKAISQDLLAAIHAGLIQTISELDEDLLVQEYKFSHDRVQQAAYALIDESQKQVVHLQIGRNLLEKTSPEQLTNRLFEIVDHLNHGVEFVANEAKRTEIARLNLMAGKKAKASAAYEPALNYLEIGMGLLESSSWQTQYQLTLAIYETAAETAYLLGNFEQMERLVQIVLEHSKTVLDRVKITEVKIVALLAQTKLKQALEIGMPMLRQLKLKLPEQPTIFHVLMGLLKIKLVLVGKQISDLASLPQMTQPDKIAALSILESIGTSAYYTDPQLFPLISFEQVILSVKYGNSPVSISAYAGYGIILCGVFGDIESGYELGQLALRLLEQLSAKEFTAKILLTVNALISHWKVPVRETLSPLLQAYKSGLETGDLEFAATAAHVYCYHSYFIGQELSELESEMAIYEETLGQLKQEQTLLLFQSFHQAVLNLLDRAEHPCDLIGSVYNEQILLPSLIQRGDRTSIVGLYLNKLILCYLFGQYPEAVFNASKAQTYLDGIVATFASTCFYFYDSLAGLALYSHSPRSQQKRCLSQVNKNQKKIKKWAHHSPVNLWHKYYLVEAEIYRVLGKNLEAMDCYDRAIALAKEHEYLNEAALAYELAAKFYGDRAQELSAKAYMQEAHYYYQLWGATAKVKDLETRYPQFFSQSSRVNTTSIPTTSGTSSNTSPITFDLAAVMKASQTISREIELEQLLRSLMQVLIQNAGAQTGYLILENAEEWAIEASFELDDGKTVCATKVLQSIPIANRLPESIINYVIRTHESVILNDATHEGNFIHEPYIQQHQSKSICCLPLLNQAKLVGVLYLENQLAVGAFTLERSQVLNLLSTQAAIAIENARLYAKLRKSESKLTQFLEAVPVGIAIVDAAGRPYYANQCGNQLIGKATDPSLAPEQITAAYQFYVAGTEQIYPTERLPNVRALKGERSWHDDMEIRQTNAIIPVEAWGTPVYDEQGNIVYAIVAFQDITERRQAEKLLANYNRTLEQQVAQRTAALRESEAALRDVYDELRSREQELRLITDALPVLISYIDINQRYQFVNRGYEVWFNCSRDEILGKSIRELIGEAAYQIAQPHINRALSGQITTYEAEIPYSFGKKYISATFIPDFASDGQVKGKYGLITDISDRKRAEDALRQSEANYRNLVQTANSIIIRFDTQGRIRFLNDYGLRFFGYEEHQILGHTLLETIRPESETSGRNLEQFIHELFHNPVSCLQTEKENLCRDGRRVWVAWSNQAILDEQGQVVEILSVGNDITQRKQAEAALQRSEAKFRNIFENSQVGIFRARLSDGLILDANQRFANLFGFDSPKEVIGLLHGADCYVNPSDRSSAIELLNRDGKLQNFEVQLRRRDGTLFWALYSARPNVADRCMEGVIADISDRKQVEEALQASETELRTLIAAIPDPLSVLTAEGRILEAIAVEPHLQCQPVEEMIGKTLHQLGKEQADEWLGYIQQALRTQQILTVEYRMLLNGRETWFSSRIAPIRHDRVIWLSRDITALKQAETASILEERNRMAREIHDTLAQAFTGILIQIGAATQVLADDPEATQAHLDTIEELARTGLTEARRSVTALRPQLLESGDLSTALARLVTQMRAATDTALIYQIQGITYPLPAEVENNLLRIGQEALTNAIKYASASEIRIELVYDDAQCCLRVKDDGQGFGVGSVPHIGGFGLLGMSERAERIGAQLRIESQPGQGTEIVVVVNCK
ncbi:PAS domain S-box protein [Chroococcidiopsis sp. FACHB-1243]|uniref:PAS domain S-box protein n=1 Tax=Chroococcidiopsis sp. [FACHB-1243] TaxID=2692781 RepID=UPI00177FF362|nr:PAS domain S-box protein [Chroococcidiopsis sp. [FACHB-1243]]MBD2309328.1 PAS domain S-box protein [Chroococcidiopsis sp. [FACHB-1243]]